MKNPSPTEDNYYFQQRIVLSVSLKQVFSTAIFLIIKKKMSLEKAFDIAFKKFGDGDRKAVFENFKEFIKKYLYAKTIYPEYSVEQIYELKIDNVDPLLTIPNWAFEKLFPLLGIEGLKGIYNKKTWIRINTLKADVKGIRESLEKKGYKLKETEIPFLFELCSKKRISETEEFKKGYVIPQDKASVLSVLFLDPKPGETILEIGSAPGIKTSLIQQLTSNKAYVISIDISESRLLMEKKLLERLGVENVELILADGLHLPIRKADKIFIDAPCSNSGTINVDPSIFIRLTRREVIRFSRLQKGILKEASKLHTITVYTTCSLFPEEGEGVVERFEKYLIKLPNKDHEGYKKSKVWLRVYRTYPHKDYSEGFFIAKLDFSTHQE